MQLRSFTNELKLLAVKWPEGLAMLDDYDDLTTVDYHDGQIYVEVPAKHPALIELREADLKHVAMLRRFKTGKSPGLEFGPFEVEPDPLHEGNGGSEQRSYWFVLDDWKRLATKQRRLKE